MANTIKLRRSATANAVPTTTQLALGELAINTFDGKLYLKKDDGTESIVQIGASSGGGTTSGGTTTVSQIVSSASVTAQKDYRYILTSASPVTITLPSSPTLGDTVYIVVSNNLTTNVVTSIDKIMGVTENLTLNVSNLSIGLVYSDATNGWRIL